MTDIEQEIRAAIDAVIMHDAPEAFVPDDEHSLESLGIEEPDWIYEAQPLSDCDVRHIAQGGCASGAYMPAVTYHTALATMHRYGDEVLDYLGERGFFDCVDLNAEISESSWAGLACFFLSAAVELFCSDLEDRVTNALAYEEECAWLQVTVGARVVDGQIAEWAIQTGDNSFAGPAYGFPLWGVASVNTDSDPDDVLSDILGQIYEQAAA